MPDDPEQTIGLLRRWHGGDRAALDELLARDLPWVRGFVQRRLGDLLGERADVDDYVQEAMAQVLEYGPRFETASDNIRVYDADTYALLDSGRAGTFPALMALTPDRSQLWVTNFDASDIR